MHFEKVTRRSLLKGALNISLAGSATPFLASCTSQPPVPPSTPPCDATSYTPRALNKPVTINWVSEESSRDLYANLVDLFHQEYKNIIVTQFDDQNHDKLLQSMMCPQSSNNSVKPDIASLDVVWVSEFVDKKLIIPLCDRWPLRERNQYFSIPMQTVTINQTVYAAPFRTDLGLLFYRKDLMQNPPKTWEDLTEVATRIKSDQKTTYGYVWQGGTGYKAGRKYGEGLVCDYMEVLYSYGGSFNLNDLSTIDSPQAEQALARMASWVGTISPKSVTDYNEMDSFNDWRDGKSAFMRNWPYDYVVSNTGDVPVGGKFDVAPLPYGQITKNTIGRSSPCLGGWCLAINSSSDPDKQEAAWTFIHWMMQAKAQLVAAKSNSWLMTLPSVYQNDDVLTAYPFLEKMPDMLKSAITRPSSPRYAALSDIIQAHIHKALLRDDTPEGQPKIVLQNMRKDVEKFLAQKEQQVAC